MTWRHWRRLFRWFFAPQTRVEQMRVLAWPKTVDAKRWTKR